MKSISTSATHNVCPAECQNSNDKVVLTKLFSKGEGSVCPGGVRHFDCPLDSPRCTWAPHPVPHFVFISVFVVDFVFVFEFVFSFVFVFRFEFVYLDCPLDLPTAQLQLNTSTPLLNCSVCAALFKHISSSGFVTTLKPLLPGPLLHLHRTC